ncbi:c-type cytochrome domain-containing protein, partial [Tautonia sociabilis]
MSNRRTRIRFRARIGLLGLLALAEAPATAPADEPPRYNRDIRPILSENCFACHGPDSAARKADLRLDHRDDALADRGGYATIVPGDPDASELIYRVESEDELEVMPPPSSHKSLTAEQKATLRRWIAAGAEYEPHWSFIPP